ncbi:MAG: GNAT family N-acetyltransferase [Solirubrobacterales bacterium]|nr:GNAT family N-acetyltransferase [Solirubrobacterales bacterium]
MDEREVLRRHRAAQRAFYRFVGAASPTASCTERDDGLTVTVCPIRPERSLVNAVLYEDAAALEAALPELATVYADAGIHAWTVWVHVGDERAARACAAAGHVLDATPELMWAPLADMDLEPGEAEVDEAPSWQLVGELNDAAYGLPPEHLVVALRGAPDDAALLAVASVDGVPTACAGAIVEDGTAELTLVATLPPARGRGLAGACIRSVLRRARDGGADLTVLEATQIGRPVYRRLGYRELGAMQMWERRVSG